MPWHELTALVQSEEPPGMIMPVAEVKMLAIRLWTTPRPARGAVPVEAL
jgi:hypothetical protein